MNLLKKFRRRLVKHPDQYPTPIEAKALWYQYAGKDDKVVALAEAYRMLLDERADFTLAEREHLTGLLIANQGEYGPDGWGKGYYDAIEDAIEIVSTGKMFAREDA